MIQPIMRDVFFLQQPSEPATEADRQVVTDLLDTLRAHTAECVGMAANMIGIRKRIIAINLGLMNMAMINPRILQKKKPYSAEEGCLSLAGTRRTTRYEEIEVEYLDQNFKTQKQIFTGWTAQIIQHEVDHCDGILI